MRLTRRGLSQPPPPERAAALARELDERHLLLFPRLLAEDLLSQLQPRLEGGATLGADGLIERHALDEPLRFLFRDPGLLALASTLAGEPLAGFTGKIRRVEPGKSTIGWHDDLHPVQRRRLAVSVNLSPRRFEGGRVQIRRRSRSELLAQAAYPDAGDALVFRVEEGLEHRSEPVAGVETKWIFSGWYCADAVGPTPRPAGPSS